VTKLEAKFQSIFSRWVQNRWNGAPAAFELKRSLTQSLPLSSIKDHQIVALRQAAGNGLYYKIPDAGFAQSPFDCFFLKGEGYLVVAYGAKLTGFYIVPIAIVERLKNIKVVSLTEKMAQEFGTYYELPKR
jgi:hypothetical protein